jgi:hypothetical protein
MREIGHRLSFAECCKTIKWYLNKKNINNEWLSLIEV